MDFVEARALGKCKRLAGESGAVAKVNCDCGTGKLQARDACGTRGPWLSGSLHAQWVNVDVECEHFTRVKVAKSYRQPIEAARVRPR